jgi:hypothetical protein
MAYAEGTTVPVEKSIAEIVGLVKKAGAERVAQFDDPDFFAVQFQIRERMVRFRVNLPTIADMPTRDGRGCSLSPAQRSAKRDQSHRQRARALLLVIKAKLESIESGVETFEEAFLANVVMANGQTLYERVREPLAMEYQTGQPNVMLLAGPGERGDGR